MPQDQMDGIMVSSAIILLPQPSIDVKRSTDSRNMLDR